MARRKRLYDPNDTDPFPISRTKIDLFVDCPRCFYLDRRHGIRRPSGPPFLLNLAVDALFKKEFDQYRERGEAHPIMAELDRDVIPAPHPELDRWRHNFTGIRVLHEPTNFELFGAIDDLWIDRETNEYLIADYKSTSKKDPITPDTVWWGYWRQLEFYQFLLRRLENPVSSLGCLVYANGDKQRAAFEGNLAFNVSLISKDCDDRWVEGTVIEAHRVLNSDQVPTAAQKCAFCSYLICHRFLVWSAVRPN